MKAFGLAAGLLLLACLTVTAGAQTLSGVRTRWSDSFVEWELFVFASDSSAVQEDAAEAPNEELYGDLQLRWLNLREDWTEWDFTLGNERGTIRMKWKDDPTQWELRTYGGAVVTMRAAWSNDLSEWRVTDNNLSLSLRSRWNNQIDEWLVQDNAHGTFYLYTLAEGDPRDWAVEDDLDDTVSEYMKLALIFLTVFHSTPRM
ncbi:MAG: hypothetical protein IPH12_20370 [Saprospirales bacterium]|jgi:hypothetical protein|nr:hypothetical protein [Saprospirales bacterium]MBK8921794.1 hypothetical protein [Saprospirales bacterium]